MPNAQENGARKGETFPVMGTRQAMAVDDDAPMEGRSREGEGAGVESIEELHRQISAIEKEVRVELDKQLGLINKALEYRAAEHHDLRNKAMLRSDFEEWRGHLDKLAGQSFLALLELLPKLGALTEREATGTQERKTLKAAIDEHRMEVLVKLGRIEEQLKHFDVETTGKRGFGEFMQRNLIEVLKIGALILFGLLVAGKVPLPLSH